ncbi:MAG: hypothetical protein R6W99_03835 [Clostridia bacterium]
MRNWTIFEAAKEMGGVRDSVYKPDPARMEQYDLLYGEYRILHDYFGRGGNDVMKRLKEIRNRQGR